MVTKLGLAEMTIDMLHQLVFQDHVRVGALALALIAPKF